MLNTMLDKRTAAAAELFGPADDVFTITPNNDADLATATKAIRVDGAGTVSFVNRFGRTCTARFAAGETRAIRAVRVRATGTTATGLEGLA